MQKSICILSNRFEINSNVDIPSLRNSLNSLPKSVKPINLIDKKRYYKHLWQHGGIMHFDQGDIFQINAIDLHSPNLTSEFDSLNHQIYLDELKQIEFKYETLTWIIFLDNKNNYGLLINFFELIHYNDLPLKTLSENKIFRYFKEPGESEMYKLKIFNSNNKINNISIFTIFSKSCNTISSQIDFVNPKPTQFHFFDKAVYHNEHEKESICYNILRIPATSNNIIEEKYLHRNNHHLYENSSIYTFAMNEGVVLMSPYKTPRQLFPNYFPIVLLVLMQKELISHLFASQSQIINLKSLNENSKQMLDKIKHLRDVIHITNYYFSLPISQYSEIQDIFLHIKKNLSGYDTDNLRTSLNELTLLVQESAERESNEREKNIGVFLGVLGITGGISFIFDYFFISTDKKLLDSLDYPFNLLPIITFLVSFFLIWRSLNKKI
jgi:hypothetical protein